jgi:hypothetical protein
MRYEYKIPVENTLNVYDANAIWIFRNIKGHQVAVMRRAWELDFRKGYAI